MADVTFTIPDEQMTRFVNGMAAHFGYREILENGDSNPETKAQYIRRKVRLQWRTWVKKEERQVIEAEEIDIT